MFSIAHSLLRHDHLVVLPQNPNFSFAFPKSHISNQIRRRINVQSSSTSHDVEEKGLSSESYPTAPFPPIKEAKRVVLVRHGQSTWNEEGRIQGSSNFSVLTKKGEMQAETNRLMLINDVFDVCFSSPLNRSKRTAEIIWGSRTENIFTDLDLREIDLYSFQGLLKREGQAKFGEAYRQWKVDAPNFNIDGHFPVRELWARAQSCWTKVLAHESRSTLIVAHNAVNQALIATALGLGYEYFRILLQSNCGVSVLDFTPKSDGGSPYICLNRLNQTPNSPIASESSGGRSSSNKIILICHGFSEGDSESRIPRTGDMALNMLGVIQSQKTAELLLDLKLDTIVTSTKMASVETANTIARVQEAADCLGADCVPRYVEMKQMEGLDVETILEQPNKVAKTAHFGSSWLSGYEDETIAALWARSGQAWKALLRELGDGSGAGKTVVAVGHPAAHIALVGHCLNLSKECLGLFHLDAGGISVIDFPDGPDARGVVRCLNYTAHLGRWSMPITKPTPDE